MSIDKCFDYINDYQQSLVADSVQLTDSLPKQVCVILKELLIPFIELKLLPSSNGLLQVGAWAVGAISLISSNLACRIAQKSSKCVSCWCRIRWNCNCFAAAPTRLCGNRN